MVSHCVMSLFRVLLQMLSSVLTAVMYRASRYLHRILHLLSFSFVFDLILNGLIIIIFQQNVQHIDEVRCRFPSLNSELVAYANVAVAAPFQVPLLRWARQCPIYLLAKGRKQKD